MQSKQVSNDAAVMPHRSRNEQTKVVSITDDEVAYILQPTAGVSRGAAIGDDTRHRIRRSHEILKAHGYANGEL